MAKHNIRYSVYGILDDSGKLVIGDKGLSESGIYIADHPGEGATQANYTGVEAAGEQKYANGQVKRVAYGKPNIQLALTMLDMDFAVKQKIKGWVSDGKGGWTQHLPKPHIAILTMADGFDGTDIVEALANTEVIEPNSNNATDTTTSADDNDELTVQAKEPLDKTKFVDPLDKTKNLPYKIWSSSDSKYDYNEILKEVFPGYQAVGGDSSTPSQSEA
ncbi:phage tail protein [Lactobacillus sp. ESL0677]|uniref:phage tail protein n=1 Tax=Lactobacillus sp. ESL0677 TaxID=2983208 RepID=UPI0023F79F93|nr:phage tail protein [Lactobacillus sp. ESL0677]WEV36215.1 phage tail protein [Lactobacillus sp. ESL0677]